VTSALGAEVGSLRPVTAGQALGEGGGRARSVGGRSPAQQL